MHMRIRGTRHACMVCMHTPSAICVLLTIELAAIPTLFAELWRGFLSTLVCEAIMSIIIYGRLVSVSVHFFIDFRQNVRGDRTG